MSWGTLIIGSIAGFAIPDGVEANLLQRVGGVSELLYSHAEEGMDEVRCYLAERDQREPSFVNSGVRDLELGRADSQIIVEEDVNIDGTRGEAGALPASHLLLDTLCQPE